MADKELPPHFPARLQALTVKHARTVGHAFMPWSTVAYLSRLVQVPLSRGMRGFATDKQCALGRWPMPWNDESPGGMTAEASLVMRGFTAPVDRRWIPWLVRLYSRK